MDYYGLSLLIASLLTGVESQQLSPLVAENFASEGDSVSLSYTFSKEASGSDEFYWYRQHPGKPPEFLLYHLGSANIVTEQNTGLNINVEGRNIKLLISSAAVTDSAVYYCAVRPNAAGGYKMFFGSGTSLTIETKKKNEPDYYNLGPANDDDDTTVCLATGFTRHNATMNETGFDNKTASQITDFSGKPSGVYSQVAFLKNGEKCGDDEGKTEVPCDANLEPDEMVNLASITIFGLRVIFMKTVAFNVLMTLRLWMSQ